MATGYPTGTAGKLPNPEAVKTVSASNDAAGVVAFNKFPLAFVEEAAEEQQRLHRLRTEDPIALQDALNTSRAFVDAVKEGDVEEMQSIVANAEEGELLQVFTMQAFMLALKRASLPVVKELVNWGMPVNHPQLSQSIHLVCEVTNRDNFSDAWRIVQLLIDGNYEGKIDINSPRVGDGWTPLCIACADACLPLAFKLLELEADPNVITRSSTTPLGLVKQKRADDSEEQKEAREIIANMLRHYGAVENWKEALSKARRPKKKEEPQAETVVATEDGGLLPGGDTIVQQTISKTQTRFSA